MVRVILGSGAFDWSDTRLTAAVLAVLSISLVAQAANLLMIRAFYAAGNTRIPLYTSLLGALLAIVAAYQFFLFYSSHALFQQSVASLMRLSDVVGSEVLAIALGYAVAVIAQSLILLLALKWSLRVDLTWLIPHAARCIFSGLVGAASAYVALQFLVDGINPDTFVGIFIQGGLAGLIGLTGVVLTYIGLNTPEINEIYSALERRLFKTDVVAPQEDVI
ncbi:MAG: lipid II flippase MurJ [Candidatus Paceibacterota bacterium]